MTKRIAQHVLRIGLTVGFLGLVFFMIDFEDYRIAHLPDGTILTLSEGEAPPEGATIEKREGFFTIVSRMDRGLALLCAAGFLIPLSLGALRWWMFMRVASVHAPLGRVFCVSYAGSFFNLFLPGMVGGDIAKAVIAARGEEKKAAIVGTIILDRVVGMIILVLMATAVVVPQIANPNLRQPVVLILSMFTGFALVYLVYFSGRFRTTRLGMWLKSAMPFRKAVQDMDDLFFSVRSNKRLLVGVAGISLLSQSVAILLIIGLARSIGITEVPWVQFFVFEPILFVVMAVPISLGGWGVGEYAYAHLFGLVGVPANQAIALSVLYKLAMMVASLPGGVLFALGMARRRDVA